MKYLFVFPKKLTRRLFYTQLEPIIKHLVNKGNTCYVYFGNDFEEQLIDSCATLIPNLEEYKKILNKIDYIYVRSVFHFTSIYLSKFINRNINAKLIYNFRGFASYENYYMTRNPFRFLFFFLFEFLAYRLSDHVCVVSSVFKRELKRHYGSKNDVSVIPCCVTEVHRKEMKIGNEIRFIYCGSTLKWQKFEETMDLYLKISNKINNTSMTFFTKDKIFVKKYIEDNKIQNVYIKYMEHQDLLIELRNHDFAFLIRDDIMLNNVSSPIKFAEYLSCGLIPIISVGVGDYSLLVKKEKLGIITEDNKTINFEEIQQLLNDTDVYERIFTAAEGLTWNKNLRSFPQ